MNGIFDEQNANVITRILLEYTYPIHRIDTYTMRATYSWRNANRYHGNQVRNAILYKRSFLLFLTMGSKVCQANFYQSRLSCI